MTWSPPLTLQVQEHFAAVAPQVQVMGMLTARTDRYLAIAHAVLRRLEGVPVALRPPGMRAIMITCAHCGECVERDARSRFCSDACRAAKYAHERGREPIPYWPVDAPVPYALA